MNDVFLLDIVEDRRVIAPGTNDGLSVQIDVQGEEGQVELRLTKGPNDELIQRVDELAGVAFGIAKPRPRDSLLRWSCQ